MMALLCGFLLSVLLACGSEANYTYRFYPKFHLGPLISPKTLVGWMNDPNGFSLYKDEYHLFYQYNPESSLEAGIAHWGHAKSKDLIKWEHLPIALYPDQSFDVDGVFSGSALIEDDNMYLYYTGNVNHPDQTSDHEQRQILATSTDGETFTKNAYNPIIMGADRQPNIRDPKVWKHEDTYYMVLGNSFNNDTLGRALLYASKDKINWEEVSIIDESDGYLGYMWECPDFFELDGYFILLFSPQGVEPQGDKYNNLYSTGYIIGHFDYKTHSFTPIHPYKELDNGHDFYATQTMIDKRGDRVMIAWMDMWEQNYPEGPDGFTGQMTLPRILEVTPDGRLLQQPVREIEAAVGSNLYSGTARGGTKVKLESNAGKVLVQSSRWKNFRLVIESESANSTVTIIYNSRLGNVVLNRGGSDGIRRTKYKPSGNLRMAVYIDSSSIEVFFGNGEVTMSSRYYPEGPVTVSVAGASYANKFNVYEMKRTVPLPNPSGRL